MKHLQKLKDRKYLPDGQVLFKYYWQTMGDGRSYDKLARWCGTEGHKSPKTGKIPHRMAVWLCMWRWALHNPEHAYEIWGTVNDHMSGQIGYDGFMKLCLLPVTHSCLNDSQYNRWKKLNNVP